MKPLENWLGGVAKWGGNTAKWGGQPQGCPNNHAITNYAILPRRMTGRKKPQRLRRFISPLHKTGFHARSYCSRTIELCGF
ncbi:MAG: hypothetical protein ACXWTH_01765 [Methylosarcina sp.]